MCDFVPCFCDIDLFNWNFMSLKHVSTNKTYKTTDLHSNTEKGRRSNSTVSNSGQTQKHTLKDKRNLVIIEELQSIDHGHIYSHSSSCFTIKSFKQNHRWRHHHTKMKISFNTYLNFKWSIPDTILYITIKWTSNVPVTFIIQKPAIQVFSQIIWCVWQYTNKRQMNYLFDWIWYPFPPYWAYPDALPHYPKTGHSIPPSNY